MQKSRVTLSKKIGKIFGTSSPKDWKNLYLNKNTPWDIGRAHSIIGSRLADFIKSANPSNRG
jgi:hypothetical protein